MTPHKDTRSPYRWQAAYLNALLLPIGIGWASVKIAAAEESTRCRRNGSEGTWKSTLRRRRSAVRETATMRSRVRLSVFDCLSPIANDPPWRTTGTHPATECPPARSIWRYSSAGKM